MLTNAIPGFSWGVDSPLEIAAALLLTALFIGTVLAAWRRLGGSARWAGVAVLNALACLAVFALLAPPALLRPAADAIVLITEGAPSAPDAVANAYVAPRAGDYGRGPGYLLDIGQLPQREPALGTLTVTGHGLEAREWQRLPDDLSVRFDPPPLSGFVEAVWQRHLTEGEPLIITGRFLGAVPANATLIELRDPAGIAVASHDLLSGDAFEFVTHPKAPGLIEYRVRVLGDDGEIKSEPIPVHVRSGQRPIIYVLQSAPSFETRQLRNWAGDNDATVIVDTVITRGHELRQRVNASMLDTDRLSPALLDATGLAIVDGRAWAELDAARRAWFEAAVREGMGLLVLADSDLAGYLDDSDTLLTGFRLVPEARDQDGYVPVWEGSTSAMPLPLLGLALQARDGGELTRIRSGEVVEAFRHAGLGRVAVSVLRERHRWLTSGDETSYTTYWAHLMSEIARPAAPPYLLPADQDPWPRPQQRLRLCAMVGSGNVRFDVAPLDGQAGLTLEAAAPGTGGLRRCAEFWPWQAGWHRVSLSTGDAREAADESYFHVFGSDQWQAQWRQARQQATLARATTVDSDWATTSRTARVDVEPLWPWLMFILSAGLLWLERRLHA